MKKIFSILYVLTITLLLTGCGNSETNYLKKVAGTYNGLYLKFATEDDNNKIIDEEFSLVLKEDGTGVSNRDGNSFDVKWSYDGETFKMTETYMESSLEYEGTLKKNKLDIFNGDKEDSFTLEYVYMK